MRDASRHYVSMTPKRREKMVSTARFHGRTDAALGREPDAGPSFRKWRKPWWVQEEYAREYDASHKAAVAARDSDQEEMES